MRNSGYSEDDETSSALWRKTTKTPRTSYDDYDETRPLLSTTTLNQEPSSSNDKGKRAEEIMIQVDDIKNITHENIGRLLHRGDNLSNIKDKAENLEDMTKRFKKGAKQVMDNKWLEDVKLRGMTWGYLGLVIVLILAVVASILSSSAPRTQPTTPTPGQPPAGGGMPGGGMGGGMPGAGGPTVCNCVCPQNPVYLPWPMQPPMGQQPGGQQPGGQPPGQNIPGNPLPGGPGPSPTRSFQ